MRACGSRGSKLIGVGGRRPEHEDRASRLREPDPGRLLSGPAQASRRPGSGVISIVNEPAPGRPETLASGLTGRGNPPRISSRSDRPHPGGVGLPALPVVGGGGSLASRARPSRKANAGNRGDRHGTRTAIGITPQGLRILRRHLGFGHRAAVSLAPEPAVEPAVHGLAHRPVVVVARLDRHLADGIRPAEQPEPLARVGHAPGRFLDAELGGVPGRVDHEQARGAIMASRSPVVA